MTDREGEGMSTNESITKELRRYAWDCPREDVSDHAGNVIDGIADRIDERFSRELQAKQDEVYALQGEILRLKMNLASACAERNGLQVKQGASIPLPLDADGVPCHIGDEIQPIGMKSFEVKKIIYNGRQKQEMVGPNGAGEYYFADICRHVAPKPETIEDVRKAKDNAIAYLAQSGVMGWADLNTFSSDFAQVFDRAYFCGKRDGAGERA